MISAAWKLYRQLKHKVIKRGEHEEHVDDEVILNTFRRSDNHVLKTGEVAESLPIQSKQTGNRLQDLHDEGRVGKRELDPSYIWWLDEDEPDLPVLTGANFHVWLSYHTRNIGRMILYFGGGLATLAAILLGAYFLVAVYPVLEVIPRHNISLGAMGTALGALLYFALGLACKVVGHVAEWRATIDA